MSRDKNDYSPLAWWAEHVSQWQNTSIVLLVKRGKKTPRQGRLCPNRLVFWHPLPLWSSIHLTLVTDRTTTPVQLNTTLFRFPFFPESHTANTQFTQRQMEREHQTLRWSCMSRIVERSLQELWDLIHATGVAPCCHSECWCSHQWKSNKNDRIHDTY